MSKKIAAIMLIIITTSLLIQALICQPVKASEGTLTTTYKLPDMNGSYYGNMNINFSYDSGIWQPNSNHQISFSIDFKNTANPSLKYLSISISQIIVRLQYQVIDITDPSYAYPVSIDIINQDVSNQNTTLISIQNWTQILTQTQSFNYTVQPKEPSLIPTETVNSTSARLSYEIDWSDSWVTQDVNDYGSGGDGANPSLSNMNSDINEPAWITIPITNTGTSETYWLTLIATIVIILIAITCTGLYLKQKKKDKPLSQKPATMAQALSLKSEAKEGAAYHICSNCRAEINQGANFCPRCGTQIPNYSVQHKLSTRLLHQEIGYSVMCAFLLMPFFIGEEPRHFSVPVEICAMAIIALVGFLVVRVTTNQTLNVLKEKGEKKTISKKWAILAILVCAVTAIAFLFIFLDSINPSAYGYLLLYAVYPLPAILFAARAVSFYRWEKENKRQVFIETRRLVAVPIG